MDDIFNMKNEEMRMKLGKLLNKTNTLLELNLETDDLLEKVEMLTKEYLNIQHQYVFALAKNPDNAIANEMLYLAEKFSNLFYMRISKKIDINEIPKKHSALKKEIERAIQKKVDLYEKLEINKEPLEAAIDNYIKAEKSNYKIINCNNILEAFLKNESLSEKALYNVISIIDPLKEILDDYFKKYLCKKDIYIDDLLEELNSVQNKYNLNKKEVLKIIEFTLGKVIGKDQETRLLNFIKEERIIVVKEDVGLNNNCVATIENGQYILIDSMSTLPETISLAHELGHAIELEYIQDEMKRLLIEYPAYAEISSNLYQLIMYNEMRIIKEVKFLFAITCMQMIIEFIVVTNISLELIKDVSTNEKIQKVKLLVDKYVYPSKEENNSRFIRYIDFNGLYEIKYSIGLIVALNIIGKFNTKEVDELDLINYFKAADDFLPEERLKKYLKIDIESNDVITNAIENILSILS